MKRSIAERLKSKRVSCLSKQLATEAEIADTKLAASRCRHPLRLPRPPPDPAGRMRRQTFVSLGVRYYPIKAMSDRTESSYRKWRNI